jgi:hypothetical protein
MGPALLAIDFDNLKVIVRKDRRLARRSIANLQVHDVAV